MLQFQDDPLSSTVKKKKCVKSLKRSSDFAPAQVFTKFEQKIEGYLGILKCSNRSKRREKFKVMFHLYVQKLCSESRAF